jgi:hypothetical protein
MPSQAEDANRVERNFPALSTASSSDDGKRWIQPTPKPRPGGRRRSEASRRWFAVADDQIPFSSVPSTYSSTNARRLDEKASASSR